MDSLDLKALKDFILTKNPYFTHGYADVFIMPERGIPMVYEGKGFKPVFPDDKKGNYFYLRSDETITFGLLGEQRLTDNGAAQYVFNDAATFYLVAVVKDADRYVLINNLRNTCAMFTGMDAIPTTAIWVNESVVVNELSGVPESDLMAALQKMKGYTIVRLAINLNKQYVSSDCINEVCNC